MTTTRGVMNGVALAATWIVVACGGSSAPQTQCGPGTVAEGNECVAIGASPGDDTSCGSGTYLSGTECLPLEDSGARGGDDAGVGRVDTRLGFGRTRLGAAAKPREFGPRQIAANLFTRGGLLFTHGLRFEQCAVAARVHVRTPAIDLDHPRRDLIEQEAVVTHENHGTSERKDLLFEPLNCAKVQVVGGFVQNEHVVVVGEELRKGHALTLPARELIDGRLRVTQHPETIKRRVGPPTLTDLVAHRAGPEERDLLEVAHAGLLRSSHGARIRRAFTRDDGEQGGFTCAVDAHDAHAVTRLDRQRKLTKQRPVETLK